MAWPVLIPVLGLAGLGVASLVRARARRGPEESRPGPGADRAAPPDWGAFFRRWIVQEEEAGPAATAGPVPAPLAATPVAVPARSRIITPLRVTLILLTGCVLSVLVELPAGAAVRAILFSATVGIGTNYIAILLLFRPRRRILMIQGVIPAKREALIRALAAGIRHNLLDAETIRRAIHDSDLVRQAMDRFMGAASQRLDNPRFVDDLSQLLVSAARAFLINSGYRWEVLALLRMAARRLPPQMLGRLVGSLIPDWLEGLISKNKDKILTFVDDELESRIRLLVADLLILIRSGPGRYEDQREQIEEWLTEKVSQQAAAIDIEQILQDKLNAMDDQDFHRLISDATERELGAIQYLGAGLGALAGLLLWFAG